MLIDTHTHLYSDSFQEDRNDMVKRALDAGVSTMLLPNIDKDSMEPMYDLCRSFPDHCVPMMGLHPGSVGADYKEQLTVIREKLFTRKHIAVGEIGMDLYWDKTFINEQIEAFREQISWAKELHLPIVIHARDAFDEIFEIIDELNDDDLRGVFHCFTGTYEQALRIDAYGGFKLGIGGVVTYKNSHLPEVLKKIDLSRLILETDAPYLPPVPYRGKRNESAYITHVADKLSDIYEVAPAIIAEKTSENAKQLFHLEAWKTENSTGITAE